MDHYLVHIGYNYYENHKFIIDRPNGSGNYLFLFFVTPVTILIQGEWLTTQPNAIVLFDPVCPQFYSNQVDGFLNDWFHLTSDTLAITVCDLGFPVNQIFYVEQPAFIRDFVHTLEQEFKMKELSYLENIDAQLTSFFIKLARSFHHQGHYTLNPAMAALMEQFRSIRSQILTNYQRPWQLEDMAELAMLSRSRFCVLYKTFFGISPKEDLLTERFNMAKHLLKTTQLSVEEVSLKVGYRNMYHFNKQFKKITELSPGRYRHKT